MTPKLRFQEFEDSWSQVTIAEAASFRRGSFPQPYNIPQWYDDVNGMPFVQVVDVGNDFRLKPKTKQMISELAMPKSVFVPKGSIVITIQGSIGRIALTQYDSYVDRTLLIITEKKLPLDDYFFIIALKKIFDYEKTIAVGGTIKTITKEKLAKFKFSLPHRSEQQRIGDFIRLVDQKINLLTKKKEALENYKKGLMQKIFSQELRFKREDGTDYPEWKKVTLGSSCKILRGKGLPKSEISSDGSFKCIHYGELFTLYGEVIPFVESFTDNMDGTPSKSGDILMPSSDVTPNGLMTASMIKEDKVFLGGDINVIRPNETTHQEVYSWDSAFLSFHLNTIPKVLMRLISGTTVKHLYSKDLKGIELYQPTKNEQELYSSLFFSINAKIEITEKQILSTQKLKKGLLQQMFV